MSQGRFRAAGYYNVTFAGENVRKSFADSIAAGSAGADDGKIGAAKSVTNSDISACSIGHKPGDSERRKLPYAFIQQP